MKLAVSNIAWRPGDIEAAFDLLQESNITGLEVAPGLLFPQTKTPLRPPLTAIKTVRQTLERRGLALPAMQGVHFGLEDAQLFGNAEMRALFCDAIRDAASLAGQLSIAAIVIGAPRQRARGDLSIQKSAEIAIEVFGDLGNAAAEAGASLALEPVPASYGSDFLTHLEDALDLAKQINHPAVGVNFDLGERYANDRMNDLSGDLERCGPLLRHVHASLPNLAPLGDNPEPVRRLARALHATQRKGWVSIEMRRGAEDPLGAVREAIGVLRPILSSSNESCLDSF